MKNTQKFIDPATLAAAGSAASVVSAIAGVAGYFAERNENRRMLEKLDEIKNYLSKIDKDIQELKQLNKELLLKLDELPDKIQIIVYDIVEIALLNERYSSLKSSINNYLLLPGGEERYLIHSEGWDEISDLLTYLFQYENRISYLFDLIQLSEFAILASDFQGTPIIQNLVKEKYDLLNNLFIKVAANCDEISATLLVKLNNENYIKSHNFSSETVSINDISWVSLDNKTEVASYEEKVCKEENRRVGSARYNGYETYTVCTYETKTKTYPSAIKFNKEKSIHLDTINGLKSDLSIQLKNYIELRDTLHMLKKYLEIITEDYNFHFQNKEIHLPTSIENKDSSNNIYLKVRKK